MNTPYVKQFNSDGEVINPIKKNYLSPEPNRRARRAHKNQAPFYGESKNYHLSVLASVKYRRLKQIEKDKNGNRKVIEHYLLVKN